MRVNSQPLHELDIPIAMKVARVQPSSCHELLVPAGVVIVGCMERLMQVADEVQKELERQELLGGSGGRIAELGCELVDLVNDAGSWRSSGGWRSRREGRMAETGRRKVRLDELDIDKVPLPSTL